MSPERVTDIVSGRLAEWGNILAQSHCTPVALVGVGHDHASGLLKLCVPEDATMQEVITLLRGVAVSLQRQEDSR